MITMEDVLEVLRETWETDCQEPGSFDCAIANWNRKEGFWHKECVIFYLERLGVASAEERVEWINIVSFEPEDILALANVDFYMRECDVCDCLYHIADQDWGFVKEYQVPPRGGGSFSSASGEEIYICSDCVATNRIVELFVS